VSGPATIIVSAPGAFTAGEPWFVRVRDYPGLGSALAWDRPVILAPDAVLERRFIAVIADGRLAVPETAQLAAELSANAA
jgi:hypothetical protein